MMTAQSGCLDEEGGVQAVAFGNGLRAERDALAGKAGKMKTYETTSFNFILNDVLAGGFAGGGASTRRGGCI